MSKIDSVYSDRKQFCREALEHGETAGWGDGAQTWYSQLVLKTAQRVRESSSWWEELVSQTPEMGRRH